MGGIDGWMGWIDGMDGMNGWDVWDEWVGQMDIHIHILSCLYMKKPFSIMK